MSDVIVRSEAGVARDDFVSAEDYVSPEFLKLENERLWPRAWLMACRETELQNPGDYLGEVPDFLDCFELEKTRLIWGITVIAPANWKLVLNAFNEGYHVEATHPQTMKFCSPRMPSHEHGLHSMFGPVEFDAIELSNRPVAMAAMAKDPREMIFGGLEQNNRMLKAMYLEPNMAAAQCLLDELPAGTDPAVLREKLFAFNVEELQARGVEWPEGRMPGAVALAGFGWHIFPNFIVLLSLDGTLCYRTRPHPTDPEQCICDIWSFGRFAPGKELAPEHSTLERYEDFFDKNEFLFDDLVNLPEVQKGMHSGGFRGLRTNPVQERTVMNLHRALRTFMGNA